MSKSDKNKLIILATLVACILISVFFIFSTKMVPIWVVVTLMVVMEFVILVPMISQKYYGVNGLSDSWSRWVPVWNELQILDPKCAYGTIINLVLAVLSLAASQVPLDLVGKIFSLQTVFTWGSTCMVIAVLFIAAANFCIGVGLIGVLKSVNYMLIEKLRVTFPVVVEAVYFVLALIPFARLGTLIVINQKLDSLLHYLSTEKKQELQEEV